MNTLHEGRQHLVRHYVTGIPIGLMVGVVGFFFGYITFLKQEQSTGSNSQTVQENQVDWVDSGGVRLDKSKFFPEEYEPLGDDPRTVWQGLQENDHIHIGRIVELIYTANQWIARDGLGILNEIFDSVPDRDLRKALFSGIISSVAVEKGYHQVFEEGRQILKDKNLRHEFLWQVVSIWAPINPNDALSMSTLVQDPLVRVEMMKIVTRIWAKTDIESLKASIATVPRVVAPHAEYMIMLETAKQSPADAVAFLPDLAGSPYEEQLISTIADHWKKSDVEEALEWVLNYQFSRSSLRNKTMGSILYELAQTDVERALKIAVAEPQDRLSRGPEAFLIAHIAFKDDVDRAIEMLPRIREGGHSRSYAYQMIGSVLVRDYKFYDAVKLGSEITSTEIAKEYFDSVFPGWARQDPLGLYNELTTLPNDRLRSRAAMHLIDTESYRHRVLTEQQLNEVKAYMSEKDEYEMIDRRSVLGTMEIDFMGMDFAEFPFDSLSEHFKEYVQIFSSF